MQRDFLLSSNVYSNEKKIDHNSFFTHAGFGNNRSGVCDSLV